MAVYPGRFLRINLSSGQTWAGTVPQKIAEDFAGGRGYGVKFLYDELPPNTDPLGPANKLILVAGPLAGTNAQSVSRWMAVTRSPLTNAYARSVCGADFGAWLKFAGYEFIIIEGKAEKPSYIHLTRDSVKILSAAPVWGKDTKATQEWMAQQHGQNTRCAVIGPAGENLVKYSAIVSGRRTAGRCGTGTVMGSKNIKGVAITAERHIDIADPDTFAALVKQQIAFNLASKGFASHREWGTTSTQDVTNDIGIYPVRNFRWGQMEDFDKITGAEYRKLRTGDAGCYSCMARCGKAHTVKTGPYAGAWSEGPEYESIWAFTGPIDSTSIEASIAADGLCDDLGLDTISTGSTIGFAYELYEKGILKKSDLDGLEPKYGDPAPMIALIKKIAAREGIGDVLAEGSKRAAEKIGKGADIASIQVKGLELPAYEPRGAKTQGYNYVTSNIGANHCYGYAAQDIFGAPFPHPSDRFAEVENADLVVYNQNNTAVIETGIVCAFGGVNSWTGQFLGKMLAAVRGIAKFDDNDYLNEIGARIYTLERAFNIRNGLTRSDDTLPKRMLTEPLHTRKAPGEGQIVTHQDEFLDKYYELRGWSKEGIPTASTLKKLGLESVVKDLK